MASLVGAITYLALSGTPGLPPGDYAKTPVVAARPNDGQFTQLAATGTASSVRTFSAKTESLDQWPTVSDRYVPVLDFANIGDVDIDVSDAYVLSLGMSAAAGLGASPADTYVPVLTFTVNTLVKTGNTAKTGADTYVPVLTMSVAQRDVYAVTDLYVPVLTMELAASASDAVVISDSYVPVLDMIIGVAAYQADIVHARSDTYTVVLTMTSAAAQAGEVDLIMLSERPYGYIRITEI